MKEAGVMAQLILTVIVVLLTPARNIDLISFAKSLVVKVTGSAYFPSPTPSMAAITAAINAFEASENAMGTTKGVKGDRAAKKKALVTLLKQLRCFVQSICDANIENASAIAESAGMRLKLFPSRVKDAISIVKGILSGSVMCDTRAVAADATYFWQFSLDQKAWSSAPEQMQAKITISGLTPGQMYYFRFCALTRKGMGDWSQATSFIVT
jgi:hypothetical protein